MLHALRMCARQWVGPPAAPTVVGGGAGAAPDCVESTDPKVGTALLIRVGAKAQVWPLVCRYAHSFLAVWAVCSIVTFCCGDIPFVLQPGRERCLCRFDLVCEQWHDCPEFAFSGLDLCISKLLVRANMDFLVLRMPVFCDYLSHLNGARYQRPFEGFERMDVHCLPLILSAC